MPVEPQKPYISSKEAAKKYGLTNDHIGLLCRRGKIQGLLWGRVWYVSEPSLEDYVKKSLALKEARKKALSKQWHAAWTAAFLAFAVFSLNTTNASADYVTPSPRLKSAPTPAAVTIASVAESIGEFQKSVPLPQVPKLEPLPAKQNDGQFFTDMGSGLVAVGEGIAAIFYTKKSTASTEEVRVVYAADFVPDSDAPSKLVAPHPKKSLPEQLTAVSQTASAALATVPPMIPTLQPIKENSFFTAENLVAGTAAANEILDDVNTALFGAYAQGARDLARIALFDATQAGYTFDRIFGEFGRQYVHDLSAANELQVRAYLKAGEVVNNGYNSLADAIDRIPSLNSSISVASAGYGSPDLGAAAGDTVTSWWNGAVEYLSNIFVAIATDSNKLASNAPAQNPLQKSAITSGEPAQHPLTSQAPQPGIASANTSSFVATSLAVNVPTYMVASVPAPAQANTTPQKSGPTLLGSSYSPELITQTQLNNQFDAWMLVVKNLIAGNTGYVNNPEVAALGGGGGGGTVNNYYSLSQRIDKLDGVTITNATITGSSVNGISDFSNLGGSTVSGSIGNWFAPLSYGNATSTTVGFNAGLLSVGSTTINGNATTTGNFDIGGGSSGSNKLVLNGINGSSVFNQEISQSISGQTSTLLFKLNHGSLPASNETNTVRFYGGNTSLEAVNENDSLGVKFAETFSTAFLGLTSTGGASGSVPSGGFLLSFALGNDGKVGSVSRTSYSSPNWRNVLDDGSGNFSVSGRAIVSGNVGIGTTSPYAKLSVAGDIVGTNIVATGTIKLLALASQNCLGTDSSGNVQAGTCGGGGNTYASTTIGGGTQITGLTISGGATTTLDAYFNSHMHVANTVYLSHNGLQFGDNGGIAGTTWGFLAPTADGVFRFGDSAGGGSPRIILGSAGAGWVSLKRNGASLDIRLGDDSGYASTTAAFFIANSTSRASTFPYASTTVISTTGGAYFATLGGNVGVGTTSPASKFSVAGSAYVAGNLTATGTLTILGGTSIGNFNVDATATCGNTYHTFIGTIGTVGGDECAALNVTQLDTNNNVIYRFGGAGQTWAGEFYANSSLVGMNTKGGLPLSFQIGQTEEMRIAANGKVGIGTMNPLGKLHIYGTQTNPAAVNFSTTSIVTIGGDSPTGYVLGIGQNTSNNTWLQSGYTGPLAVYTDLLLQPLGGKVGIGTTSPGSQLSVASGVSIGGYAAAAPDSGLLVSGKVGIGTDNPFRNLSVAVPTGQTVAAIFSTSDFISAGFGTGLQVYFGASTGDTYAALDVKSNGLNSWNNLILQSGGGGVGIGTTDPGSYKLLVNGSAAKPGGGSWTDSSDERLKTDITHINSDDALSKILALKPVTFAWRNPDLHGGDQAPGGFIAQDLMQIFPEFVSTTTCIGADCVLVGGSASSTASTYNLTLPFKFFGYLVSAVQDIANLGPAFKNNLLAWLGDAGNGINKLFAKEVHTDTLCVGNTCVTQEQFLAMVAASSASQSSASLAPAVETPAATSTPEVSEDSSSAEATPPESEASSTPPAVSSDASTSTIE